MKKLKTAKSALIASCLMPALFFTPLIHAASAETRPPAWQKIKNVVVIVFENTARKRAVSQPFFKSLLAQGAYLQQSYAITHPSQPNYIALVGGSTLGVTSNSNVNLKYTHIGDLLDAKKLTWKTYAEGFPGNCFLGATSGEYARKHNPLISFTSVQSSPTKCARIVNGPDFFSDMAANRLPSVSFYIPDLDNDGHDTGIAFADKWFKKTFGPIFANQTLLQSTLFIITFDEDNQKANNNIYTVFLGAGVKPGAVSTTHYTHYNVLRTIEDIFGVGTLGRNDATATTVNDIWIP